MPLEDSTGVNSNVESTSVHRKNTQRTTYNRLTLPSSETGAVPFISSDSTYVTKGTDRRYRRQNCVIAGIFVLSLTAMIVALIALALVANQKECSCGQSERSAGIYTGAAQSAASSTRALQDQVNEVKRNVVDLNAIVSAGLSQNALDLLSVLANISRLDTEFFAQVDVVQTFVNDLEQDLGERMALLEGSNISTSQLFLDKFVDVEVQIVSQNATLMSQINRVEQNVSNQIIRVEQNFSGQINRVEQSVSSWSQSMTAFTSQIGSAAACDGKHSYGTKFLASIRIYDTLKSSYSWSKNVSHVSDMHAVSLLTFRWNRSNFRHGSCAMRTRAHGSIPWSASVLLGHRRARRIPLV